jgi:hypothetical protein
MQLVLRLRNAQGAVVYSDTVVTRLALSGTPTCLSPSVQFLVPSSRLAAGLTWQVVRDVDDPTGTVLGTASGESMQAAAPSGGRLSVLCSDAVRTVRSSVIAPN